MFMVAAHSHRAFVALNDLPVAAASLDDEGVILDANRQFLRLFGISGAPVQRLDQVVAETHRAAVLQALSELRPTKGEALPRCGLAVMRCRLPCLWLGLEVRRLGPESGCPFLVCAQPMHDRRRRRTAPSVTVGGGQTGATADRRGPSAPAAAAVGVGASSWPAWLTTLSHELRGPLNAVRGWLSMIEGGSLTTDGTRRAHELIRRNTESLSKLVECLFDLSRNAAGSLELNLEVLDLNQLVELVVDSAHPAAARHGVRLIVSGPRRTLFVNGDQVRLEQVVRNLVDNAIKFTPRGGQVTLRARDHHPFAELVVRDTGLGISAELLPAIFDPFRRGFQSSEPDTGVGLGLALVQDLVRLHRGEIRATSKGTGQGATFIVRLPLAAASFAPNPD